jgi:hypothetical protein
MRIELAVFLAKAREVSIEGNREEDEAPKELTRRL